jgi:hypothetical protein
MNVTPLADDLYAAVKAFLVIALGIAPAQVIKGLGNRVSAPPGGSTSASYVVMTQLTRARLRTNIDTFDDTNPAPVAISVEQGTEVMLQLDIFGLNAADQATIVTALWRDGYACAALAPVCQPLYCDEPRMMPLVDGEEQYEQRYTITAHLQYNPVVAAPQQFANALGPLTVIDVDERYAP